MWARERLESTDKLRGYMTSWTVGHTHRFKAAVVGAPCVNCIACMDVRHRNQLREAQWGGSVISAADKMLERSPISYAAEVDTPVLLLHGEATTLSH
ncbi:MAG: hypothetical protein Ct9H300mP11_11720 [Chloroflexota bacterium]|nr:MAG: hypothetical protein Ct9H300mP11_11720 [Chloroflexota bacterium]